MKQGRRLTTDGYDRIGPFHPAVACAAVLVLDLVIVAIALTILTAFGDWVEDLLFPGGVEWITLL